MIRIEGRATGLPITLISADYGMGRHFHIGFSYPGRTKFSWDYLILLLFLLRSCDKFPVIPWGLTQNGVLHLEEFVLSYREHLVLASSWGIGIVSRASWGCLQG